MTNLQKTSLLVASITLTTVLLIGALSSSVGAQGISYKDDVFPIMELRCLECHQPGGQGYEKSGLDLRTYEGLMKGTKYGSVVTPRSAIESSLIAVIERRTKPEIWMPHDKKKLSKCERQAIHHWVLQGARNN